MKFWKYTTLPKFGGKVVCLFGVFTVSPKGTEAKEASNLLAFLIYKSMLSKVISKIPGLDPQTS
ncbi:MAG TPA: hypothetical protein VMW74_08890 [Nitrosopumilaceae archaeon]|jgi:hypothetical protein|nr:hypothetical protein [Nitrosopumilaceae archaeon]